jgi:hypothetical protein
MGIVVLTLRATQVCEHNNGDGGGVGCGECGDGGGVGRGRGWCGACWWRGGQQHSCSSGELFAWSVGREYRVANCYGVLVADAGDGRRGPPRAATYGTQTAKLPPNPYHQGFKPFFRNRSLRRTPLPNCEAMACLPPPHNLGGTHMAVMRNFGCSD